MEQLTLGARLRRDIGVIVRKLRRQSGLSRAEVARLMDVNIRSYDRFEEGHGPFDIERIFAFAEVIDTDPFAVIIAALIGQPEFAWRCAENKLATIFVGVMQMLNENLGDDLTFIDPGPIIGAGDRITQELKDLVLRRDVFSEDWFNQRTKKLNVRITLNSLRLRRWRPE